MPRASQLAQDILSEKFNKLQKSTKDFVEQYTKKREAVYTFSSILPYNQERIRAAELIQKISSCTTGTLGDFDIAYQGKNRYWARKELHYDAIKGALFLALLSINEADKQYKQTWTGYFFKPTPLENTALFSLSLHALEEPSLEAIDRKEMSKSLTHLSKYLTIMQKNELWGDTNIPDLLASIERAQGTLETLQVEERHQAASAI